MCLLAFYACCCFASVGCAPVKAVAADEVASIPADTFLRLIVYNIRLALCGRCSRRRCGRGSRCRGSCCRCLGYGCCRGGSLCGRCGAALCVVCAVIFIGVCLSGCNIFLYGYLILSGVSLILHSNGCRTGCSALHGKASGAAGVGRYGNNAFVRRGVCYLCGIGSRCLIRDGVNFRGCRIANIKQPACAGKLNACYAVCGSGAGGSGFAGACACRGAFGSAFAFRAVAFRRSTA